MDDEYDPLCKVFAAQLKRLRLAKGWSQEALGRRMGFSGEMVSKVESARYRPSSAFAAALDSEAFPDMGGLFTELLEQSVRTRFQRWAVAEQEATVIRWWQPLLVPGLLQTEGYVCAIHNVWRAIDGVQNPEADVAARLERQAILDREVPPSLSVVLDESVLRRQVGGAKVMHGQLLHLAEMSERPRVTIQVFPSEIAEHVGLLGAFAVAGFAGGLPDMMYTESLDYGTTSRDPGRVERIAVAYDALRSEALGARASRDLIRKIAEEIWTA